MKTHIHTCSYSIISINVGVLSSVLIVGKLSPTSNELMAFVNFTKKKDKVTAFDGTNLQNELESPPEQL